jgi:ketosteroid isomerase-like protein
MVHDGVIANATPTGETDTMNRNTDDHKNTNDTEGHAASSGRIEEADTDGHSAKFRPEDTTDEADTEGNSIRGKGGVDEADTTT